MLLIYGMLFTLLTYLLTNLFTYYLYRQKRNVIVNPYIVIGTSLTVQINRPNCIAIGF